MLQTVSYTTTNLLVYNCTAAIVNIVTRLQPFSTRDANSNLEMACGHM